jgi:hypothetical protein
MKLIMKSAVALSLVPLAVSAQGQSKQPPQSVQVVRNTVRPGRPGLVSFRLSGSTGPEINNASVTLTLNNPPQGTPDSDMQIGCQKAETLWVCPVCSNFGRPSGTFRISGITVYSSSPAGQLSRVFKGGQDFQSGPLTVENAKAPTLDSLKIEDVDVDGGESN